MPSEMASDGILYVYIVDNISSKSDGGIISDFNGYLQGESFVNNSVITVIGKDRVGIVYDVSKILAENQINILNISQQLMDDFFTMIILVDTSKCTKSRQEVLDLFAKESKKLALDIRMQNEEIFQAMHRI